MQIFHEKPQNFGPCVLTIGTFDGVHAGHKKLIQQVTTLAHNYNLKSLVLTFDPVPARVPNPESAKKLICTVEDRLQRIGALGVDAIWVQHYDLEFALYSAEDFVREFLVKPLNPEIIVVGQDMRFGRDNEGSVATLTKLGSKYGFAVQVFPDVSGPGMERRWSSTMVRDMLQAGDVDGAARVLGHPHRVRGRVVHGKRRGRELGFPTANLDAELVESIPADGVYAGWLWRYLPPHSANPCSVEVLPAAISVGTSPHFGDVGRTVEAHVLGRSDLNLYDEEISVDFVHRIRENRAFDSLERLLHRMEEDLVETADVLGVPYASRVNPEDVTA